MVDILKVTKRVVDAIGHSWNHVGGGYCVIDRYRFPQISVVIPTYNRANLLSRSIQSVLNQTYEDFEIIVVDDASSDGTEEIIKHFDDQRIKYIRHEENRGAAAARNTGIRYSRSNYIGFLDDDDEWAPVKLERQIQHLEKHCQADVVYTGMSVCDSERGKIFGILLPEKSGSIFSDLLVDNCVGTTSSVLMRKECLENENLFDEEMPSCQDWDMWLNLSRFCVFDFVKEPLTIYHIHKKRISTSDEAVLLGRKMIFEKYKEEIISNSSVSGKHHLMIGSLYCRLGDMKRGREEMRKSIKLRPIYATSYIMYFVSFLGATMYSIIYRFTPAKCKWWMLRSTFHK